MLEFLFAYKKEREEICEKKVMKKILVLFIAFAIVFPFSTCLFASSGADVENIEMNSSYDPGDERGPIPVQAYLYHASNTLIVSLQPFVGTASIMVFDSTGLEVYSTVVDATLVSSVQFSAPTIPGDYYLEIQSAYYYGIGAFTI